MNSDELAGCRLYHGTTHRALKDILGSGIKPRPTEGLGSWQNEVSRSGYVYLTQTHAIHYAIAPERKGKGNNVILEVSLADIPEYRLYPDEDYLAQEAWEGAAHQHDTSWSLDVAAQKHLWRTSLDKLGNIAVEGTIPPSAISRYVILSRDRLFWEEFGGPDSARLITRYGQKKASIQNNLTFLFDIVPTLKDLPHAEVDRLYSEYTPEERERIHAVVRAVQVVTLDNGRAITKTK